jgi:hypothetical protein
VFDVGGTDDTERVSAGSMTVVSKVVFGGEMCVRRVHRTRMTVTRALAPPTTVVPQTRARVVRVTLGLILRNCESVK